MKSVIRAEESIGNASRALSLDPAEMSQATLAFTDAATLNIGAFRRQALTRFGICFRHADSRRQQDDSGENRASQVLHRVLLLIACNTIKRRRD